MLDCEKNCECFCCIREEARKAYDNPEYVIFRDNPEKILHKSEIKLPGKRVKVIFGKGRSND